jgi:hypothetical protein
MPLSFKERKKILKNTNTLDLTPIKLHNDEVSKDGMVTVFVPKFKNELAKKYIVPMMKSSDFNIKLDELGSEVWKKMDGKNKVHEIIEQLSEKFGDEFKQPEERITKYLFQLYEQKLISFNELNQ